MVKFTAIIEKFESNGEKTGWSYLFIPAQTAQQINPNESRSYRVKGFLDAVEINGMALIPMGGGDFILALKTDLRKKLRKEKGNTVQLQLTYHHDFKPLIPADLELCLADEPDLLTRFLAMPLSHQNYFFNWLNGAKTENTRVKRLAMILNAMSNQYNFSQMIRASQGKPINREE